MIPISYKRATSPAGSLAINYNSPQAKGLIAYWPMLNNDSGMVARNLVRTGGGNTDLKWKNTSTPARKFNYKGLSCAYMPGASNDYWQAFGSWPGNSVTFSIWAYFKFLETGTTQSNELFERGTDNTTWGFQMQMSGPKPVFYIVNQTPAALSLTATSSLVIDRWYHIAGSYNIETTNCRLYVNGRLDNSGNLSATSIRGSGEVYTVGATETNARRVNGYLADARVYNRALTDAEVKNIYDNPTGIFANNNIISSLDTGTPPEPGPFNPAQFFMVM